MSLSELPRQVQARASPAPLEAWEPRPRKPQALELQAPAPGSQLEVARASAGAGVASVVADSTEMPAVAGAAGRSPVGPRNQSPAHSETITSAAVAFTNASLALPAGDGAGVCAIANCVPSSAFTSEPGIGLGSIAGPEIRSGVEATAAALGAGDEIAAALFNQPKS